jgi:hypothetical protein
MLDIPTFFRSIAGFCSKGWHDGKVPTRFLPLGLTAPLAMIRSPTAWWLIIQAAKATDRQFAALPQISVFNPGFAVLNPARP